jgi:hypothetical protein
MSDNSNNQDNRKDTMAKEKMPIPDVNGPPATVSYISLLHVFKSHDFYGSCAR